MPAAAADLPLIASGKVREMYALGDRILMMTNGPKARIGEVVQIALPRPRDRIELAENPEYAVYRKRLLEFLYRKQRIEQP